MSIILEVIILHLLQLKMEPDKEHSLLPFILFSSKEKCCWCTELFVRHIVKMF